MAALEYRSPRFGGRWERLRAFVGVLVGSIIAVLVIGAAAAGAMVTAGAIASALIISTNDH